MGLHLDVSVNISDQVGFHIDLSSILSEKDVGFHIGLSMQIHRAKQDWRTKITMR